MTEIPILSQVADIASEGISLTQGDYIGAGASVLAVVPVVGAIVTTYKVAKNWRKGNGEWVKVYCYW